MGLAMVVAAMEAATARVNFMLMVGCLGGKLVE
jgi:hypothetical protein